MAEAEASETFSDPPSPSASLSPPPARGFFDRERHVMFLEMMYHMLPYHYQSQEINRLTLAYFVISGLDLLNALDRVDKDAVAQWVLSLQAHPRTKDELPNGEFFGFHGSRSSQFPSDENRVFVHNGSHLASTYCAVAILKIIDYDLSSINSGVISTSMRNLQQPNGSFMPIHTGAETDLRFIYCAGGATYCAIASLRLMGFIDDNVLHDKEQDPIIDVPLLVDWSLRRQVTDGGLQGRPNKPSDTCYAFWIGATLRTLGGYKLMDEKSLRSFLLTCQSEFGGFSKFPGDLPDLYHSYYGLTAFSLLEEPGLNPLCAELGITEK